MESADTEDVGLARHPPQRQQQSHHQRRHQKLPRPGQQPQTRQLADGGRFLAPARGIPGLDVVRALHQTVISLRTELDSAREELRRLADPRQPHTRHPQHQHQHQHQHQQQHLRRAAARRPPQHQTVGRPGDEDALERLSLENHWLRGRLLEGLRQFRSDAATSPAPVGAAAKATDDEEEERPPSPRRADDDAPSALLVVAEADRRSDKPSSASLMDAEPSEEPATPVAGDDEADATPPRAPDSEPERPPGDDRPDEGRESAAAAVPADGPAEPDKAPAGGEDKPPGGGGHGHNRAASNESENESEELDDIELIFTTEETCRDLGLQEDLVSIAEAEAWQQRRTPTPSERPRSVLRIGQSRSADSEGESRVCNGGGGATGSSGDRSAGGSVDEAASSQSSSIDREESVDRFDESSSGRLNKMWSQCSVLVETDISKCGVLEEAELAARHTARRNTLAAPPAAYRPIIHREALAAAGRRKSAAPLRPLLGAGGDSSFSSSGGASSAGQQDGARRESGAQTDISALPAQWRSESYLAHKVAHAFTTLPSKFALPAGVPGRLRLSDKTREARRVMLSDISFTSMVPELSRSADHLCHEPHSQFPQSHCYNSRSGIVSGPCAAAGLRTPEASRRESWARGGCAASSTSGLPSLCDCRLSTDLYAATTARYRGSLSSIPTPSGGGGGLQAGADSRRHSWRPNAVASFDGWRAPACVPGAARHQASAAAAAATTTTTTTGQHHLARPTWSSMPSSPTHVQPPCATVVARLAGGRPRRTRSKVTFQECPLIRGSLPNLRSEHLGDNSGDSTESLIDEAEDYLRRSIDSMLTMGTGAEQRQQQQQQHCCASRHSARRRRPRRHSEPDLFREWNPPQDARPYLPKIPRDLKLDHLVKVISPEGRILQGRVRYVGRVAGREEEHVGVELPSCSGGGTSDGTFHGKRYFDCEPERAVFVPFKKVVLAWCTT